MLVFEKWPKPDLLERFLELVLKIYEDRAITRTELTVRLEHAFLIGTRAKDVKMRRRFMTIFNDALSESANKRLECLKLHLIFGLHDAPIWTLASLMPIEVIDLIPHIYHPYTNTFAFVSA